MVAERCAVVVLWGGEINTTSVRKYYVQFDDGFQCNSQNTNVALCRIMHEDLQVGTITNDIGFLFKVEEVWINQNEGESARDCNYTYNLNIVQMCHFAELCV